MEPATPSPSDTAHPWRDHLETHWRLAAFVLFALAVVVRLVYGLQIRHAPIPELWRGPQTDMFFFVAWAKIIAAGDWLTDRALHPYFSWQQLVGTPEDWNAWYGGKTFHQAPAYPYLLAVLIKLAGPSLWWLYALQSLGSALTVVLVASIGRRMFSARVGLLAGAMAAVYGPLVFYDFVVLRTSLTVLSAAVTVWLLIRAESSRRVGWWLAAGVSIGLAYLLRPNATAMLVLAILAAVMLLWRQWRRLAIACGGLIVGFGLCLIPPVVRNVRVGAPPLSVSALGPSAVYLSNAAGAPGTGWGMVSGYPQAMRRTGGRFAPMAREALASHASIAGIIDLYLRKLTAFFHYFERTNNASPYYAERFSGLLRYAALPFWLVLPLGLVGLYATWPDRRRLVWLYIALLVPLATVLIFYQTARFRVPVIVGLIPLAAAAVDWMLTRRTKAPLALVIAVALCAWVRWPGVSDPPAVQERDFGAGAKALAQVGRHEAAIAEGREALKRFPNGPRAWLTLIQSLHEAGRLEQAAAACDVALERLPDHQKIRTRRADIHLDQNRPRQAAAAYRALLRENPYYVSALIGLSRALTVTGPSQNPSGAVQLAVRAVAITPYRLETYQAWANALNAAGMKDQAIKALDIGLNRAPPTDPRRADLEELRDSFRQP